MAESDGKKFLADLGAGGIKAGRKLSADQIQKSAGGNLGRFWPVADGEVLIGDQYELYQAGRFNDTPVLIGTNSDEGALFVRSAVTPAAFEKQIREGYGAQADTILNAYPHSTDKEAFKSTKDIFRETAFAWHTWAWARLQSQKGKGKRTCTTSIVEPQRLPMAPTMARRFLLYLATPHPPSLPSRLSPEMGSCRS